MYSNATALIFLPFLLAGCLAQSDIQAKYMRHESQCHSQAQSQVDALDTEQDPAYVAGSAFSECMNGQGWKVTSPKPPKSSPATGTGGGSTTTASTTPPIGPSTSGGIPGGTASGAAAKRAPGTGTGTTTPAAPVLGPGVQPDPARASEAVEPAVRTMTPATPPMQAPAPSVSMPKPPTGNAPSAYQPQDVPAPEYGRGAGRNF